MLKRLWKNIVLFIRDLRDFIRERDTYIKRAEIAEENAKDFESRLAKYISENRFDLNAEMSTKVRVWLKENAQNEGELFKIVSMTSEALATIPKKKYVGDRESFVRDYRDLTPHAGLSKSKS